MTAYWVLQKRVMPNTSRPEYHVHGKDWRPFDSLEHAQHTMAELIEATQRQAAVQQYHDLPVPSFTFTVVIELDPSAPHREQGAPQEP